MMGGGEIIASFLDEETIDEFIISVLPTFIGEGIQNDTSRAPVLRRPAQMRLTGGCPPVKPSSPLPRIPPFAPRTSLPAVPESRVGPRVGHEVR
ncbi:MAG: hypothetical protein DMG01_27655 [Acidobacteria bacterium]|nr:MAG: hypothetical protein DMG01_27655 [Acidobacteriota bacterium]PYR01699.1 MAG: hypothetical protein DMG00_30730 [Acidobacteriota bacterium]